MDPSKQFPAALKNTPRNPIQAVNAAASKSMAIKPATTASLVTRPARPVQPPTQTMANGIVLHIQHMYDLCVCNS